MISGFIGDALLYPLTAKYLLYVGLIIFNVVTTVLHAVALLIHAAAPSVVAVQSIHYNHFDLAK